MSERDINIVNVKINFILTIKLLPFLNKKKKRKKTIYKNSLDLTYLLMMGIKLLFTTILRLAKELV